MEGLDKVWRWWWMEDECLGQWMSRQWHGRRFWKYVGGLSIVCYANDSIDAGTTDFQVQKGSKIWMKTLGFKACLFHVDLRKRMLLTASLKMLCQILEIIKFILPIMCLTLCHSKVFRVLNISEKLTSIGIQWLRCGWHANLHHIEGTNFNEL